MPTYDIYNLDLGSQEIGDHYAIRQIGPFELRSKPDYLQRRKKLPLCAARVVHQEIEVDAPIRRAVEEVPENRGELVATAEVSFSEPSGEQSILQEPPVSDEGLVDLCTLLSFVNGRPVTCDPLLEHLTPNISGIGNSIGYRIETPQIAACLWAARDNLILVKNAIHYYNGGIEELPIVNSAASLFFTALNVLWDATDVPPYPKLEKQGRKDLISTLHKAMGEFAWPGDDYRERYEKRIEWAINDDKPSAGMCIQAMLRELGIIGEDDLANETISKRVKGISRFRNLLLHSGKLPDVKGGDEGKVLAVAGLVGINVIPSIIKFRVLQLVGCDGHDIQHRNLLCEFFGRGTWHGFDPHTDTFMEYLDNIAPLEEDE